MSGWNWSACALLLSVSSCALMACGALSVANAQNAMSLDAITVLATKTEEKTTDALAAVSSIRSDQIGQIMADKASNVFFGVPGVWFQERADDPGSSVNIRGLQDFGRVAVLIDGARQNFQRSGHNADGLYYFEPELLAGADVVRGPIANIYGSGAIGGVVSLRTKDVDDVLKPGDTWGVLSHGQLGSNRFKGLGSTFLGVRANPNVDVFVGGTYRDHLNYRDGNSREVLNSAYQTDTGIAKVTVRPALGHEVKFSGLTYDTAFRNGTPNSTNSATVYDSTVKNQVASARWKYHRPEDRLMDFDANVYWTKTETNQTKIAGTNSSISGLLGSTRNFQIDTVGTDINNTSRFDTGAFRHAVTYGGDWFRDRVNVVDPTGTGDLFTPNGERTVGGGFAQLKSSYSTWLDLVAAIRYDNFNLSGGSTSSNGDRFSPKATIGITPVAWFTLYGTYAEGYRAPAITEVFVAGQHPNAGPGSAFVFLQNGTLRPEVGKTKEVGINVRQDNWWFQGDAFRMKANVFRNDVEDFIEQKTVLNGQKGVNGLTCTATDNCIQYQNLTRARIDGAEFEATYDMGRYFYGLVRHAPARQQRRHQGSAPEDCAAVRRPDGRCPLPRSQAHDSAAGPVGRRQAGRTNSVHLDALDVRLHRRESLRQLPDQRGHSGGYRDR